MEKRDNPHAGHRQRKKEQFRQHGLDAFAPHEALELLLYYAIPRADTNGIAHALLRRFGTLEGVFSAPVEELTRVEGVGENAALLLRLVPQICRKMQIERDLAVAIVNNSTEAGSFFLKYFWGESTEMVMTLSVDAKGKVRGCHKLSQGGVAAAGIDVWEAVSLSRMDGAVGVYVAHNHPSGLALPSRQDYAATLALWNGMCAAGLRLLDHIVVADGDFVAMFEDLNLSDTRGVAAWLESACGEEN